MKKILTTTIAKTDTNLNKDVIDVFEIHKIWRNSKTNGKYFIATNKIKIYMIDY